VEDSLQCLVALKRKKNAYKIIGLFEVASVSFCTDLGLPEKELGRL